ncbi:hypothetical protein C0991_006888, partial [Blastosporella zonata]
LPVALPVMNSLEVLAIELKNNVNLADYLRKFAMFISGLPQHSEGDPGRVVILIEVPLGSLLMSAPGYPDSTDRLFSFQMLEDAVQSIATKNWRTYFCVNTWEQYKSADEAHREIQKQHEVVTNAEILVNLSYIAMFGYMIPEPERERDVLDLAVQFSHQGCCSTDKLELLRVRSPDLLPWVTGRSIGR